jgi:hypothetical protein
MSLELRGSGIRYQESGISEGLLYQVELRGCLKRLVNDERRDLYTWCHCE